MNQEQLTAIAKEVFALNPECLLSGSLALRLQGRKTRREPLDLDIFLPYKVPFVKPEGMISSDDYGDNGEYDDEGWQRRGYKYKGVKIDVFQPEGEDFELDKGYTIEGIPCVDDMEIIKFKLSHAFGDAHTRYKHRNDLIYHLIES